MPCLFSSNNQSAEYQLEYADIRLKLVSNTILIEYFYDFAFWMH